ncbi:ABC transporter permease [Candidatus Margulisiibacteriota bacterium]
MGKYIFKRLLQLIPLLIGISLITFFIIHMAPGDPTSMFASPDVKPEEIVRIRANWGLDKPVIVQYFVWASKAVRGDLGISFVSRRPVIHEILERLPATLLLMVFAYLIMLIIAIPAGVLSAVKKGSWFDNAFTVFSFFFMSIPTFWLALVFILIFSMKLGWFPSFGMYDPLLKDPNIMQRILDVAWHMVLPVATMVIVSLAAISRYQRASMLEVLRQEYIKTARAKGLPERMVIFKHALRNALLPIITLFGLSLPDLFGGAFIIETIFAWPGMGRLGVQAVFQRNYPMIMAIAIFSAILIVLGNLFADIGYAMVDPRIRYKKDRQ